MPSLKLIAIAFIGMMCLLPAIHSAMGPDNFDAFAKWLENLHGAYRVLFIGAFWVLVSLAANIKVPKGSIAIVRRTDAAKEKTTPSRDTTP